MNLSKAVARVTGFFKNEVKVHPVTQSFRDEIKEVVAKQKAANEAGVPVVWPPFHHEGLVDQTDGTDWDGVPVAQQQSFGTSVTEQAEKPVGVIKAVIRAATHATDLALAEVGKATLVDHGEGITLHHGSTVLINPADIGHTETYNELVKGMGEGKVMRPEDVYGPDHNNVSAMRQAGDNDVETDSDTVDVQLTDMVFWDHFLTRLAPKGCLVVTDEHHLISKKSELARGYGVVRFTLTGEAGIVHVTKNGLNALFPTADGQFRAVSNNNRFDGKTLVQVEQAKGFLNGRY